MINIALQFIIAGTLNGLAGFGVKGERLSFLELSAEVSLAVVILEILSGGDLRHACTGWVWEGIEAALLAGEGCV